MTVEHVKQFFTSLVGNRKTIFKQGPGPSPTLPRALGQVPASPWGPREGCTAQESFTSGLGSLRLP